MIEKIDYEIKKVKGYLNTPPRLEIKLPNGDIEYIEGTIFIKSMVEKLNEIIDAVNEIKYQHHKDEITKCALRIRKGELD